MNGARGEEAISHHLRNVVSVIPELAGGQKLLALFAKPAAENKAERGVSFSSTSKSEDRLFVPNIRKFNDARLQRRLRLLQSKFEAELCAARFVETSS